MSSKPTLYMETTKKEPEETITEIQLVLKKYRLSQLRIQYDDNGNVDAVCFAIAVGGGLLPIKLPCNWKALWELAKAGETKYIRDEQQARRVAWRQVYRWIQAQCALLQIGMVDIKEIFLPYILVDNKKTLYQQIEENSFAGYLEDKSEKEV